MNFAFTRAIGLSALACLIGAASSQAAVQAHFHLPVATHWGSSLLAPGEYKIMVSDLPSGRNQFIIQGEGSTVYAMPLVADDFPSAKNSSLKLVEVGGTYFVREYRSEVAGKTFTFGVPKQFASPRAKTVEIAN